MCTDDDIAIMSPEKLIINNDMLCQKTKESDHIHVAGQVDIRVGSFKIRPYTYYKIAHMFVYCV